MLANRKTCEVDSPILTTSVNIKNSYVFAIFFTVLLLVLLIAHSPKTFAFSGSGNGTSGNPYQISTCAQLQSMNGNLSSYYELVSDIDCSASSSWNGGAGFLPVGNSSTPFTGSLNGQHYTIINLSIDNTTDGYVGLFGEISGSTISNLNFLNANISGTATNAYTGVLAGEIYESTVSHVTANGTVTGYWPGGLGGDAIGTNGTPAVVSYSGFSGSVTGTYAYAGGLFSYITDANLSNSYANTSSVYSIEYTGGLVGGTGSDNTSNYITDSYAISKSVSGYCGYTGGLAGFDEYYSLTNDFAAAVQVGCNGYSEGFVGADINGTAWSNNYCDTFVANQNGCVNTTNASNTATAVDTSGTDPQYFYSDRNPPLSSWLFSNAGWVEHPDTYPTLYGAPMATSASLSSTATATTITPTWSYSDPGLEPITSYNLEYRLASSSGQWTTVNLSSPTATAVTISNLAPSTTYVFQLTATNNYGISDVVDYTASTLAVLHGLKAPDTGYRSPQSNNPFATLIATLGAAMIGLGVKLLYRRQSSSNKRIVN